MLINGASASRAAIPAPRQRGRGKWPDCGGWRKAVAFGAIKIHLEHFPPQARRLVLERRQPRDDSAQWGVEHSSHPGAFVRVTSTRSLTALQLSGSYQLFGRRNVILDSERRTLAQVVEILPPSNGNLHSEKDREKR
jgi:hypothetical protein